MVSTVQRPLSSVLNVISIYEDFIGAVQACEAVEWLHHHFDGRMRIRHRAWSYATLAGTDLRHSAYQDWEGSDLLIVSGHGDRHLPANVRQWINECFQQNSSGPAALVALFDFDSSPENFDEPLSRDLRQIAWCWRLEFISNEEFEARMNTDFSGGSATLKAADSPGFQFLSRGRTPPSTACAAPSLAGQA